MGIDICAKCKQLHASLFAIFIRDIPRDNEKTSNDTDDDLKIIAKICTSSEATEFSDIKDNDNVCDETLQQNTPRKLNPEAAGFDRTQTCCTTLEATVHSKED